MKFFLTLAILLMIPALAFAQTEQAPIQEKKLKYKDWTYKSIRDNQELNLRELAQDKKLVLVVYFAPWCPNWKHEAPFVQKLYEKYKKDGFEVVGVGEYDTVAAMKSSIDNFKITFPVVFESDSQAAKLKTLHYEYRREAGDTRNWGSPWNIFLEPAALEKKGDVLAKKAYIANGELIEAEAEQFVRQKLGLSAEESKAETANKTIEACDDGKTAEFQKP